MSDLSASQPDPSIAQVTAQMLIVPGWMARTLAAQLRSVSPNGSIFSVAPPPKDPRCQFAANQVSNFR